MDPTSPINRNVTKDLLAKTEIDAQLALDTLLENITSASLITLVRPDMEFLAKAVPDLSRTLRPFLGTSSSGEIEKLKEAQERIWNAVTSSEARDRGEHISWTQRIVNSIRFVLSRVMGASQTQSIMNEEGQREVIIRAGRISHILLTSEALENAIKKSRPAPITASWLSASGTLEADYQDLKRLLQQAELVSKFTRLWARYETAWRQHIDEGTPLTDAIKAGDAVIHSLYDRVSLNQQLRLRVPGQQLVSVFYESRVLTRVSDFPVQYIVAPYWGHKLVWNWLAFAHEIGHHVWANLGEESDDEKSSGVSIHDELFVQLAAYLLSETSPAERAIWSKWIEEMFADLFCLLCIGPAAIHSMLHMFFALPPQDLNEHLKMSDPKEWLRRAYDDEHPMPYLRVFLNIDTLRILDSERFAPEIESISTQWSRFFSDEANSDLTLDVYPLSYDKGIPVGKMRAIGMKMLDIMLNTPLFALGRRDQADERRTLKEAFFDGQPINLEQKILNAQEVLKARNWEECKRKLLNEEFEIRHLLAALQFEFERLTNDPTVVDKEQSLKDLSSKMLEVFGSYGEDRLLLQLKDKKQDYFRTI